MSLWDKNRVKRYLKLYGDPREKKGSQSQLCSDIAALIPGNAESLLDFGCGIGHLIPHLPQNITGYLGIDFSKEMRLQAELFFPDKKFIKGNAVTRKGLKSIYGVPFDVTTAVSLLLHLEEEEAAEVYKNMWIWTKPGGRMIFSMETNGNSANYRTDQLLIRNQEPDKVAEALGEALGVKDLSINWVHQKVTTNLIQEFIPSLTKVKLTGFEQIARTTLFYVDKPGE